MTYDLFSDHSAGQVATERGLVGRAAGGRDTVPTCSEAVSDHAAPPGVAPAVNPRLELRTQEPDASNGGSAPLDGAAVVCKSCHEWTPRINGMGYCTWLPHWTTMGPNASCHFELSRWRPIDASSLARRQAQLGIDRAASAADLACEGWTDSAYDFVKNFAAGNRGRAFIGHEIVAAAKLTELPQPENDKAWGQPIQRAAREKIIKRTARGWAPDPNRHQNPVPEWESA